MCERGNLVFANLYNWPIQSCLFLSLQHLGLYIKTETKDNPKSSIKKTNTYTVANLLKIHFWGILTDMDNAVFLKFPGQ